MITDISEPVQGQTSSKSCSMRMIMSGLGAEEENALLVGMGGRGGGQVT